MTGFALDHPLVGEYLTHLEAATAHLPADERNDVRQGIRDHLREALRDACSDADVRNVLDAVGRPEEIVDPPTSAPAAAPLPPPATSRRGPLEVIAVVMLLIGGIVVPVVGWIVGVVLLWMSKAWTTRQKLLGTFVLPGGLMGSFVAVPLALFIPVQTCTATTGTMSGPGSEVVRETVEVCSSAPNAWATGAALVLAIAVPILVAIYLLRTAGRADPAAGATAGG